MDIKKVLGTLMLLPGIALLGGTGLLFWNIGQTWTESTTQMMVAGFVTVCGGGFVVFALILALIVGVPMGIRFLDGMSLAKHQWNGPTQQGGGVVIDATDWQQLPPAQPDVPPWQVTGGGTLDLLTDQDSRFSHK